MNELTGALSNCPSSDVLMLGMLVTADGVIPDTEVQELWERTLESTSQSILLHRAYILYRLKHFAGFNIEVRG